MAGREEKLPTLTISFQQLQERSRRLTSKERSPHGGGVDSTCIQTSKSKTRADEDKVYTGGLLYISPTKEAPKAAAEERVRRPKGRSTPNQDTGSQRKLFPTSAQEDTTSHRHKTTPNQDKTPPTKKNGRLLERGTKPGRHNQEESQRSKLAKTEDVKSEQSTNDILKEQWSRHENRKIERALSKWSGDMTKLKQVIQSW